MSFKALPTSVAFRNVEQLLKNKKSDCWELIGSIVQEHLTTIVFELNSDTESLLNVLLKEQPPVELIQTIVDKNPKAAVEQRIQPSNSRTSPLSVLVDVKFVASADVIRVLCEGQSVHFNFYHPYVIDFVFFLMLFLSQSMWCLNLRRCRNSANRGS